MPRSSDDGFDNVLDQVEEAFSNLGIKVQGDSLRDALRTSLETAWEAADDLASIASEKKSPTEPPKVVVLEGGRTDAPEPTPDASPPSSPPRPHHLHVASAPSDPACAVIDDQWLDESFLDEALYEDEIFDEYEGDALFNPPGSAPHVFLVGRIHVDPGDDQWQTVFRGSEPKTYRIACTEGLLEVALDGALVERVLPRGTIDVEASLIRVRAGDARSAIGAYSRVS